MPSTVLSTTTSGAAPRARKRRPTRQAEAVLQAVGGTASFRSAQDIHAALRTAGQNVGLTTVYRHLQALTDDGLVDALQAEHGETVYRQCESADHHHHIVCRQCGTTAEVESPEVERWADRVASAAGYSDVSHTVEVFGLCATCTRKRSRRR
jgi:Fur family ferric uptake transcriptional regulator